MRGGGHKTGRGGAGWVGGGGKRDEGGGPRPISAAGIAAEGSGGGFQSCADGYDARPTVRDGGVELRAVGCGLLRRLLLDSDDCTYPAPLGGGVS